MHEDERVRASKLLSRYLRHSPDAIGLTLETGGWVNADALLESCRRQGLELTRDELTTIVETSDKKRFSFDESRTRIRANQGHSVAVDLQLAPVAPPGELFHGTVERVLPAILRDGLLKMRRHHVHLSADIETAKRVGARRGPPIVLIVQAAAMEVAGHSFFRSANGVWLTDRVPPEFLRVAKSPSA